MRREEGFCGSVRLTVRVNHLAIVRPLEAGLFDDRASVQLWMMTDSKRREATTAIRVPSFSAGCEAGSGASRVGGGGAGALYQGKCGPVDSAMTGGDVATGTLI